MAQFSMEIMRLTLSSARKPTTDASAVGEPQLGSQYITVMEVGGAYAHCFFDLLTFLELRTLIITDIDSVSPNGTGKRVAVPVAEGTFTSNGCLKAWFDAVCVASRVAREIRGREDDWRPAAFLPGAGGDGGACGRSFEDAFILANTVRFPWRR